MKPLTYDDYRERVADVIGYVHHHLDDDLTVPLLAQVACLSPYHFQRVFGRVAGERVGRLVRRMRLERAAWQLQNSSLPIYDIAFQAGFDSQEAFARAFRRAFGSHATDFRAAVWQFHHILTPNRAHFSPSKGPDFEAPAMGGDGVAFTLAAVSPLRVRYRSHVGAPSLIAKSLRELANDLKPTGFDVFGSPMLTFALNLGPGTPVADVESFVAVPAKVGEGVLADKRSLGGGLHFISDFEGYGEGLGDYWFRLWTEGVPASGAEQRPGPCFQVLRFSPDPRVGMKMNTRIYIPVSI